MKLSTVQKAFLALVIANVIWGAGAPILKLALTNIPLFTLAFWRFFLGAIIILAFYGKKVFIPPKMDKYLKYLVFYAVSGITVNIIFFFLGLKLTLAMNAPVIASSQPILTLIFALIILKEKFKVRKFIGMLVGTIGIGIIVLEPLLTHGQDGSVWGNIFILIATLGAVGSNISGKMVLSKIDPMAFTFWAFIIGAASFLPPTIYEWASVPHLYQNINGYGLTGIIFGAIFASFLAYSLFGWGLSKIEASDAALFSYIDPIVGTVLSFIMLGEPITRYFIIGSIGIFIGIFIAEGRIHYHPWQKILKINQVLK
jgi:drug/metabolite transporter (DMT)-like permease